MKKLIFISMLAILNMAAFAEHYKVTADKLNIRACANKNCEVIGQLYQNDIVDLLEKTTSKDGDEWGKIVLLNGEEGFIMTSFVEPVSSDVDTISKNDNTFGPLEWIGIFFVVLFIILFQISKRKMKPIFMGVGDLILLIVALVCFFAFIGTLMTSKEFQTPLLILSIVFFLISIFMTLRKPYSIQDKVFSICAKTVFILTGVSIIVLLVVWIGDAAIRKQKGKDSLWKELKEMSKNRPTVNDLDENEE